MRYIIISKDETGNIGSQLKRWETEKKIDILEKGEPLTEIKLSLERLAKALRILKKSFIDEEIMEIYLAKKTGLGLGTIHMILSKQNDFYKKVGLMK